MGTSYSKATPTKVVDGTMYGKKKRKDPPSSSSVYYDVEEVDVAAATATAAHYHHRPSDNSSTSKVPLIEEHSVASNKKRKNPPSSSSSSSSSSNDDEKTSEVRRRRRPSSTSKVAIKKEQKSKMTTRSRQRSHVVTGVSGMKEKKNTGIQNHPCVIDLLSDSDSSVDGNDDDDDMKDIPASKPSTRSNKIEIISLDDEDDDDEEVVEIEEDDDIEEPLPPPSIFAEHKVVFPTTIDTLFRGDSKDQEIPVFGLLSTPLIRLADSVSNLQLMWPDTTPIPSYNKSGGGFYIQDGEYTKGTIRTTHSRVARLAGTITIHVRMSHALLLENCLGIKSSSRKGSEKFLLAEQLITLLQKDRHLSQDTKDSGTISTKSRGVLLAIQNLNDMDNPFKERCVYAICERPVIPRKSHRLDHVMKVAEFKFHVYFRRTLFGLAANPNIRTLLDALQPLPSSRSQWKPCRQVPNSTNVFRQSPRPDQQKTKSLPAILWQNESTGLPVPSSAGVACKKGYQGVNVTLRDYQHHSVYWMKEQENRNLEETGGGVAGLNGFFWERRTLADGDPYYYFPLGGQILLDPPPVVTGGMLAQEMGLGKTISALELICSDANDVPADRGGTLVVVPVSLLAQWENEIRAKTPHLTMFSYHGSNVDEFNRTYRGRLEAQLSKYDVVLTTMGKLKELSSKRQQSQVYRGAQRSRCLEKVRWHRLIIDECQFLKNDTTAIARAASTITATHVWMLSGTPLTNKLDDLRGELSLLRVWPFTLGTSTDSGWRDYFWEEYVKKPWDSGKPQCLAIIHQLMKAVSMRHSRLQTHLDGSPLVNLPPRTEEYVAVTPDSNSSSVYVNRWVEALASQLLASLNRFDVRVYSAITKLRQLTSSPGILLDQASLLQINDLLSTVAALPGDENLNIEQLSLHAAIAQRKNNNDCPVLQELILLSTNGTKALSPCLFCKRDRLRPAYTRCNHALCVGCCLSLLADDGSFRCPVCSTTLRCNDISEVVVSSLPASRSPEVGPIQVDLDQETIDQAIFDQASSPTLPAQSKHSPKVARKYEVIHHGGEVDFQLQDTSGPSTFESLRGHPKPHLTAATRLLAENALAYVTKDRDTERLVRHAAASSLASPKIKALCDTVQSIRSRSLEAKICIFSSFSKVLDHVEEALTNVCYTVEFEPPNNPPPGRLVRLRSGQFGHVLSSFVETTRSQQERYYRIKLQSGVIVTLKRENLQVDPYVVGNVPSRYVRKKDCNVKLSANGSDDRHAVGTLVDCRRPIVASTELQVGYSVTILPDDNQRTPEDGKVVFVHRACDTGEVTYSVLPDGHVRQDDGSYIRKKVMLRVPPSRLRDKGGAQGHWEAAKVIGISTRTDLNDQQYTDCTGKADPFEHAIGYVRLDGTVGDGFRRGEILDTFKRDPMTSICLLTKTAAGVGLNLTDANYVIILEPSMDAHDEIQSIARVHRIGQTREVSVLKFYLTGSVEERILKRRQQRGELSIAINAATGTEDDEEETCTSAKADKNEAEVSSSRAMTFDDLKLLLGSE